MKIEELNALGEGYLPGHIGFEILSVEPGRVEAHLAVRRDLLAPNGYLHAAVVVALSDMSCGYGTMFDLPADATGFTTIELKSNFLGTARDGDIRCVATRVHAGRATQVWDATVTNASEKVVALFRCTQMILYPREKSSGS